MRTLGLAAVVSLVVLVSLGMSYFSAAVIGVQWPPAMSASGWRCSAGFVAGDVNLVCMSSDTRVPDFAYSNIGPVCWHAMFFPPNRQVLRHSLFNFYREMNVIRAQGYVYTDRLIIVPSWAFMPLCLVAPVLWLRRRRRERRRERGRGFAVVVVSEAKSGG